MFYVPLETLQEGLQNNCKMEKSIVLPFKGLKEVHFYFLLTGMKIFALRCVSPGLK